MSQFLGTVEKKANGTMKLCVGVGGGGVAAQ